MSSNQESQSKLVVKDYINNERKHLFDKIDEYNNMSEWFDYAQTHIYYHLLVVTEGVKTANDEIEKLWLDNRCNSDDDEDSNDDCGNPGSLNWLLGIPVKKVLVSDECHDDEIELECDVCKKMVSNIECISSYAFTGKLICPDCIN